jgi:hypothetical protein
LWWDPGAFRWSSTQWENIQIVLNFSTLPSISSMTFLLPVLCFLCLCLSLSLWECFTSFFCFVWMVTHIIIS